MAPVSLNITALTVFSGVRPLHGVPIVFKDSVVTLEMEATSGSTILIGAKPANESTVAANLRRAGCVVLGKAVQTEWQNFRYTNQPTGWTARRGQCTGAFYPNMKASGSSTGSAVATSLGLAFAKVGAEVCARYFECRFSKRTCQTVDRWQYLQPRRQGKRCRAQGNGWAHLSGWNHAEFELT